MDSAWEIRRRMHTDKPAENDKAPTTKGTHQGARFFLVALCGFVVDLSVVWVTIAIFDVPDYIACVMGFIVATTGCYFAHRNWTFRDAPEASAKQFASFWMLTISNLVVRLALFTALGLVFLGDGYAIPVRLAIAGAVPFIFAYLMSSRLIFADRSHKTAPPRRVN